MLVKSCQAFSLIELIIVLIIIGLIVSIALPHYQHFLIKSRRADARTSLYEYSQRIIRCLLITGSQSKCTKSDLIPAMSLQGHYKISFSFLSGKVFKVIATPIGLQSRDLACAEFILFSNQRRSISGSAQLQDCW